MCAALRMISEWVPGRGLKPLVNLLIGICCGVFITALNLKYTTWTDESSQSLLGEWNDSMSDIPLPDEKVPDGGIYFLETSGLPFLSPKQLCAIESAALSNPSRSIITAVTSRHLIATVTSLRLLKTYSNIKFVHLNVSEWLKGTVLENWLKNKLLQQSPHRTAHTSDILRVVALFKHGGTYLDLDVIVLHSLDSLKNCFGLMDYTAQGVANGVMSFDKAHPLMGNHILEINRKYDKNGWTANGPAILTRVLRAYCDIPPGTPFQPGKCKDVELMRKEIFYPVHWQEAIALFQDQNATSSKKIIQSMNDSLLVHHWNEAAAEVDICPKSQQILGLLARKHCPIVSSYHANGIWAFREHVAGIA